MARKTNISSFLKPGTSKSLSCFLLKMTSTISGWWKLQLNFLWNYNPKNHLIILASDTSTIRSVHIIYCGVCCFLVHWTSFCFPVFYFTTWCWGTLWWLRSRAKTMRISFRHSLKLGHKLSLYAVHFKRVNLLRTLFNLNGKG